MKKNKILIINHIFWPDNINTARHISELAEELFNRSWDVSVLVGNRDYRSNNIIGANFEVWKNVKISRVYVPKLNNNSIIGRLLTSFILIIKFAAKVLILGRYDAIILGSNPPFSFFLVPYLKLIRPKSKIILWSFDLYPDAIFETINLKIFRWLSRKITSSCYRRLDVLVDIGDCMKTRLMSYGHNVKTLTLTPWSFIEQDFLDEVHSPTRKLLFGDAKLTLMYTGTIGFAHEFDNFLSLARSLRLQNASIALCFAGFGKKMEELKSLCNVDDSNIVFADFVNSEEDLRNRISTADLMMVSLKNNWTGISVPSKFFTSIATGKPVLFSGANDSAINLWINEFGLGFHSTSNNIEDLSKKLIDISDDIELINQIKFNCLKTYNNKFSKKIVCDNWSILLNNILENK